MLIQKVFVFFWGKGMILHHILKLGSPKTYVYTLRR